MMQMLGSFAEFERSMVRERTRAGLAPARDRGVKLGRPGKLTGQQQQEVIRTVRDGSKTAADAARLFGLHRSNITRLLARVGNRKVAMPALLLARPLGIWIVFERWQNRKSSSLGLRE